MKLLWRGLFAACVFTTLAGPVRAQNGSAKKPMAEHVFIISFDGGKPSVMQDSKMPVLTAMRQEGAGTWEAQTVFPSVTLVSHTSMLTGVGPKKHQVYWNDWEPSRGMVKATTVFKIAKEKGLTTAMFAGKEKFRHLNVAGTLDKFAVPAYAARTVASLAALYIKQEKPNLCFIHFADSDGAGHQYGWGSTEQKQAFADEDRALEKIKDAIEEAGIAGTSVILMSADHGGHDRTHGSNSPDDMTIPWIAWGANVKRDFKITSKVTTYDTAATALWLLDLPIPKGWDGKPVKSAFMEAKKAR